MKWRNWVVIVNGFDVCIEVRVQTKNITLLKIVEPMFLESNYVNIIKKLTQGNLIIPDVFDIE